MPSNRIFFSKELNAYVRVTVRKTAVRFRAWWKGGEVVLSVPAAASIRHIEDALSRLTPRLKEARPARLYDQGSRITFPEGEISIEAKADLHGQVQSQIIVTEPGRYVVRIELPEKTNYDDPGVVKTISSVICKRVHHIAEKEVLPMAQRIADRIGRKPAEWKISHGHRILGNCDSRGIIRLSLVLVFLPDELREYVICHELAHLTEMNHSPKFHALLDSYLGGRKRELETELKNFRWPIVK